MSQSNPQADWKSRIAAPKQARAGEVMQIRTLIAHPMESGYRLNSVGKPIPRDIITQVTCNYEYADPASKTPHGDPMHTTSIEVFRAELQPAISANPYLEFYITAIRSGELHFTWTDQHGASVTVTHTLQVLQ